MNNSFEFDNISFPLFADPVSVGKMVSEQFLSSEPEAYAPVGYDGGEACGGGKFVMYAISSLWLNALKFARNSGDKDLEARLVAKFEPFYNEKRDKCKRDNHVDFSVFGTVPLEIYRLTGDRRALEFGLHYADHQWAAPDASDLGDTGNADYDTQMQYLADGFSPQSRLWIEDMYMITVLQIQAYLATGDIKYVERTAREMAFYLDRMQLPNGLFYHSSVAPFHWGRGNGWVAGGMPLLLQYLPETNEHYGRILAAYRLMMGTLLSCQHPSGLWGQLVDDPQAWDESSCSGMFTSSFVKGVRLGLLDAAGAGVGAGVGASCVGVGVGVDSYADAAAKAWMALCSKLDKHGNIADVGAGTNCNPDRQFYLDRPRINGAPHGQAALLWTANALLEDC